MHYIMYIQIKFKIHFLSMAMFAAVLIYPGSKTSVRLPFYAPAPVL